MSYSKLKLNISEIINEQKYFSLMLFGKWININQNVFWFSLWRFHLLKEASLYKINFSLKFILYWTALLYSNWIINLSSVWRKVWKVIYWCQIYAVYIHKNMLIFEDRSSNHIYIFNHFNSVLIMKISSLFFYFL